MGRKKDGFYAIKVGRKPGIYSTWAEVEEQVKGFSGAKHQKFSTRKEAETWIQQDSDISAKAETSRAMSRGSSTTAITSSSHATSVSSKEDVSLSASDLAFLQQYPEAMIVYADGSCINNGKANARAGSGVHWAVPADGDYSERLPGKQTNQCAELFAIVRALQTDPDRSRFLLIRSDSVYTIKCMTIWIAGWVKRGWRNSKNEPVENKELIELAYHLVNARKGPVKFEHVAAHVGIPGNEKADALALAASNLPEVRSRDWEAELAAMKEITTTGIFAEDTLNTSLMNGHRTTAAASEDEAGEEIDSEWLLDSEDEAALQEHQNF